MGEREREKRKDSACMKLHTHGHARALNGRTFCNLCRGVVRGGSLQEQPS